MHIVVLIGRDPVVLGYRVAREIGCQLLQGSIILGERVRWGIVVAAIGAAEKNLGIMLGRIVILIAAVVLIGSAGESTGKTAERHRVLTFQNRLVVRQVDIYVLLIRPP